MDQHLYECVDHRHLRSRLTGWIIIRSILSGLVLVFLRPAFWLVNGCAVAAIVLLLYVWYTAGRDAGARLVGSRDRHSGHV